MFTLGMVFFRVVFKGFNFYLLCPFIKWNPELYKCLFLNFRGPGIINLF